jgi:hypothetical protein
MKFPVIQQQLWVKIEDTKQALDEFVQELRFVKEGKDYDCDSVNKKFKWVTEQIEWLKKLHAKGIECGDFCPCNSELVPHGFNSDDEPYCRECENVIVIESSGL